MGLIKSRLESDLEETRRYEARVETWPENDCGLAI